MALKLRWEQVTTLSDRLPTFRAASIQRSPSSDISVQEMTQPSVSITPKVRSVISLSWTMTLWKTLLDMVFVTPYFLQIMVLSCINAKLTNLLS